MPIFTNELVLTRGRYELPKEPDVPPTEPDPGTDPEEIPYFPRWVMVRGPHRVATIGSNFFGVYYAVGVANSVWNFLLAPGWFTVTSVDATGVDAYAYTSALVGAAAVLRFTHPTDDGLWCEVRLMVSSVSRAGSPPAVPLFPAVPFQRLRYPSSENDNDLLVECRAPYTPANSGTNWTTLSLRNNIDFAGTSGWRISLQRYIPPAPPVPPTPPPEPEPPPEPPNILAVANFKVWAAEASRAGVERFLGINLIGEEPVDPQGRAVLDCRYDERIVTHQLALWRGVRYYVVEVVVTRPLRTMRLILARM